MPAVSGNPGIKFNLPFTLGIPDAAPANMPEEMKPVMQEVYNAFQQLQLAIHTYLGLGQQLANLWSQLGYAQTLHLASPTRLYMQASEAITFGYAVNIFDSGAGVMKIRLANATNNTKPCHGFCTTLAGIALDGYGEVILQAGLLSGVAGLTKGNRYFLSTTNGLVTNVAPVAAGNIEQVLGWAIDTSALLFNIGFGYIQH